MTRKKRRQRKQATGLLESYLRASPFVGPPKPRPVIRLTDLILRKLDRALRRVRL